MYFLADAVSSCNKQQGGGPSPLHIMMNEPHISRHLRDLFILGYYGDGFLFAPSALVKVAGKKWKKTTHTHTQK